MSSVIKKRKMVALAVAVLASIGIGGTTPVFAAVQNDVANTSEATMKTAYGEETAKQPVAEEDKGTVNGEATAEDAANDMGEQNVSQGMQEDTNSTKYKWLQIKPSEEQMNEALQKYAGRTIVAIEIKGVSEDMVKPSNVAVRSKPGDMVSANLLQRDMTRLMDTGYFYDMYVSFREVPEGVVVEYNMLENPMLTSIEIVGNSDAESTDKLMEKVTLKPGQRLNRRILHDNLTEIQRIYVEDGYVMAKVNGLEVNDDGKLVIRVNEGVLEGFRVKGNKKTKEYVILREMRMKVGEPVNRDKIQRSYQRINNLGFFESVDMKPAPGVEPNAVILEIDVKERNTGVFGFGIGYSSSEGFLGMVNLGDRNFRGTGDSISATVEIGARDYDNRGWNISYTHPWLDSKETSLSLRVFDRRFQYDDYNSNGDLIERYMRKRKGFDITFGRPQTEYSTNYISLGQVDDTYLRSREGEWSFNNRSGPLYDDWRKNNFGLTRYIKFAHVTDTRDNYMYPMNGRITKLTFTYAGLGGDFKYQKYEIDETRFYQVGHAQVLAVRGMYGYSPQTLPESDQFRIGGQNTIRGYREEQFRGNGAAMFKIEYRFPVNKTIKGAVFADSGGAWDHGLMPKNFKFSVGFGLSIDTPIGALRFDLGRGSQGSRFHFNIGNAF